MMRRLMQERNIEVKQTIETTIAQHIQCLNKAIAQEKMAMYRRSTQINKLRAVFDALTAAPVQSLRVGRSEETIIDGFGLKLKDGTVQMMEKIIEGTD